MVDLKGRQSIKTKLILKSTVHLFWLWKGDTHIIILQYYQRIILLYY